MSGGAGPRWSLARVRSLLDRALCALSRCKPWLPTAARQRLKSQAISLESKAAAFAAKHPSAGDSLPAISQAAMNEVGWAAADPHELMRRLWQTGNAAHEVRRLPDSGVLVSSARFVVSQAGLVVAGMQWFVSGLQLHLCPDFAPVPHNCVFALHLCLPGAAPRPARCSTGALGTSKSAPSHARPGMAASRRPECAVQRWLAGVSQHGPRSFNALCIMSLECIERLCKITAVPVQTKRGSGQRESARSAQSRRVSGQRRCGAGCKRIWYRAGPQGWEEGQGEA